MLTSYLQRSPTIGVRIALSIGVGLMLTSVSSAQNEAEPEGAPTQKALEPALREFIGKHELEPEVGEPTPVGNLWAEGLHNLSGLARSRRNEHVLWVLDDRPIKKDGQPSISAVQLTKNGLGTSGRPSLQPIDVQVWDCEALCCFTYENTSYLVIADTGTNKNDVDDDRVLQHGGKEVPIASVHFVKEPLVKLPSKQGGQSSEAVKPAFTIHVELPSRESVKTWDMWVKRTDIEALAVDAEQCQLILMKKRMPAVLQIDLRKLLSTYNGTQPGESKTAKPNAKKSSSGLCKPDSNNLVSLNEQDGKWRTVSLPALGEWERSQVKAYVGAPHENPNKYQSAFVRSITGLDIRGSRAVVLTYRHAYIYERDQSQGWASAFEKVPRQVQLPFPYTKGGVYKRKGKGVVPPLREAVCFASARPISTQQTNATTSLTKTGAFFVGSEKPKFSERSPDFDFPMFTESMWWKEGGSKKGHHKKPGAFEVSSLVVTELGERSGDPDDPTVVKDPGHKKKEEKGGHGFADIVLYCPEDVTVTINGVRTRSRGTRRAYRSPLPDGKPRIYVLELTNSRNVTRRRTLELAPGKPRELRFTNDSFKKQPAGK